MFISSDFSLIGGSWVAVVNKGPFEIFIDFPPLTIIPDTSAEIFDNECASKGVVDARCNN